MTARRKPPPSPEWATEIPGRSPVFKIHNQRGHAIAALKVTSPPRRGTILHWNAAKQEWDEWLSYEPPSRCAKCGKPFTRGDHPYPVDRKADTLKVKYIHSPYSTTSHCS